MKAINMNLIRLCQNNLLATVSLIVNSIACLSFPVIIHGNENGITELNNPNKNCPSHFYRYLSFNDDESGTGGRLFYNCKDLTWLFACNSLYDFSANCTNPDNNVECSISNSEPGYCDSDDDVFPCTTITCNNGCQATSIWNNAWETKDFYQSCVPYIVDAGCPATIEYFQHSNLNWKACHNDTAIGTFTNPRHSNICFVKVVFSNTGVSGIIVCLPPCPYDGRVSDPTASWVERDIAGFIVVSTFFECLEKVNDKSCSIPYFNHDELIWNWCIKGDGHGQFTNTFQSTPQKCTVKISSVCTTKAKSCGVIDCGNGDCTASWNMPDKLEYYEYPDGCISQSNPISPDNKNFIIPVSVAGGVVFVVVVSAIVTIAACFGYHHCKRQGYQAVE